MGQSLDSLTTNKDLPISAYKRWRLLFSSIRVRWKLLGAFLAPPHPSEGRRKSFSTQTNIKTYFCNLPDCLTYRQFMAKIPKYRPSSCTLDDLECRSKLQERVDKNRETVWSRVLGNFGNWNSGPPLLCNIFSKAQLNLMVAELYWSPNCSQDSGGYSLWAVIHCA